MGERRIEDEVVKLPTADELAGFSTNPKMMVALCWICKRRERNGRREF